MKKYSTLLWVIGLFAFISLMVSGTIWIFNVCGGIPVPPSFTNPTLYVTCAGLNGINNENILPGSLLFLDLIIVVEPLFSFVFALSLYEMLCSIFSL